MTLLFTTWLCLDPCHTSSLSLSFYSEQTSRWRMDPIGHKAFDPNIGTAKTLAENNLHAGTRYPLPLSLCRRYSKCEIISPPLIHAQPAGSRANPSPLPSPFHLLPRIPCNPILTNALLAITTSLTSIPLIPE